MENPKVKKALTAGAVLLVPQLALAIMMAAAEGPDELFWIALVLVQLGTAAWVVTFLRWRPCATWLLPISLLATMVAPWIYDTLHPGWLQYMVTILVVMWYAFPWAAGSTVAVIVQVIYHKNKQKRTVESHASTDQTEG